MESTAPLRLGLFGGTYNPIHSGHVQAAQIVRDRFDLDQVWFIPSHIPPHKSSDEVASSEHRMNMVRLAVTGIPGLIPSSIEIEDEGTSYSILTLGKIKKHFPAAHLFFILGVDAFVEIDTWRSYEQVLEQCSFIVISRPGYDLQKAKDVLDGAYANRMLEVIEEDDLSQAKELTFKIYLISIDALDIASTQIRKTVKTGGIISGLVPLPVEEYIKEHKLYQGKK
jgi:nicotinate-nucleotide adenylyltransferase